MWVPHECCLQLCVNFDLTQGKKFWSTILNLNLWLQVAFAIEIIVEIVFMKPFPFKGKKMMFNIEVREILVEWFNIYFFFCVLVSWEDKINLRDYLFYSLKLKDIHIIIMKWNINPFIHWKNDSKVELILNHLL